MHSCATQCVHVCLCSIVHLWFCMHTVRCGSLWMNRSFFAQNPFARVFGLIESTFLKRLGSEIWQRRTGTIRVRKKRKKNYSDRLSKWNPFTWVGNRIRTHFIRYKQNKYLHSTHFAPALCSSSRAKMLRDDGGNNNGRIQRAAAAEYSVEFDSIERISIAVNWLIVWMEMNCAVNFYRNHSTVLFGMIICMCYRLHTHTHTLTSALERCYWGLWHKAQSFIRVYNICICISLFVRRKWELFCSCSHVMCLDYGVLNETFALYAIHVSCHPHPPLPSLLLSFHETSREQRAASVRVYFPGLPNNTIWQPLQIAGRCCWHCWAPSLHPCAIWMGKSINRIPITNIAFIKSTQKYFHQPLCHADAAAPSTCTHARRTANLVVH